MRVITANSAQEIPNFSSKLITHPNTILNIHNSVQKEKKEKKREKGEEVGTIILG